MSDILIIYYSYTGNSRKIAKYAQEKLNADILELQPKIPFSDDYDKVVEEWQNNNIKRDVEIETVDKDLTNYKKIVLITSTWWYGINPVMTRFLKEYDLSGKEIIVTATNAGWIGHCFKDYKELLPNSNIKGELDIVFSSDREEKNNLLTSTHKIDEWLKKLS